MKKILVCLVVTVTLLVNVQAHSKSEPVVVSSDSLQWMAANGLPGAKVAIVSGNPEKKEPFIARIKLPANFQIPVHQHAINEYDTVISGILYLGVGDKADKSQVIKISKGNFVMIPAKLLHYGFTKKETVLQVNGVGPWGMIYNHS